MLNKQEQADSTELLLEEPKSRPAPAPEGKRRRRQASTGATRSEKQVRDDDEEDKRSCVSRSSSGCSSRNSVEDPQQEMDGDSVVAQDDDRISDNCSSNGSDPIEVSNDDDDEDSAEELASVGSQRHLVGAEHQVMAKGAARWRASGANKSSCKVKDVAGQQQAEPEFRAKLVWTNIVLFVILHSSLPIAAYLLLTQRPFLTLAYSILGIYASGLGVTGGSHRLWSHRAYKAKWPVQVLLVILQTMAGQNSIYTWSRDHRVHHKFAETNADPHNIKRGFFFAHMGWLCCKKHPDVKEKGKLIDMSDLEANPYVMFQHRHFWWMAIVFTVLVPTMIPIMLWGERFWTSFIFSFMIRYLITLHGTWLVNSAAHYYGDRPYDTKIEARESPYVIYNALGEGFHNYHHTFPYDYATSEFGKYLNITTAFIDLCAWLGLVDERRKVDRATIMKRRLRTGDLGAKNKSTIDEESADHQDSADRRDAPAETADSRRRLPASLNNIIHELPYISGLFSMKYTM